MRGARRAGQPLVEEWSPIRYDECAIGCLAQFAAGLAFGIAIDDDDILVIGLAPRLGLGQLRRVERAVAATADDHHVSQRINLPPSMTRMVPVA